MYSGLRGLAAIVLVNELSVLQGRPAVDIVVELVLVNELSVLQGRPAVDIVVELTHSLILYIDS